MMSTKKQRTRMTIYRLVNLPSLECAIREKYRTNNDERLSCHGQNIKVGNRDAFLFEGTIESESAKWAKTIAQITNVQTVIGNKTALAVLLISAEKDTSDVEESTTTHTIPAWAITFGMGFQTLDAEYIDIGFGKKIAIRSANPDGINMVGKVTLDEKPQMIRSTIPSGGTLRRFGFDEFGELATRIITEANLYGIGKNIKIKGSDSLSVPLPTSPQELLDGIDQLETILNQPVPESLKSLDHLTHVKNPDLKNQLEQSLVEAILDDSGQEQLAISYPYDVIDEIGDPEAYKILGTGRPTLIDGYPTLDKILSILKQEPKNNVSNKLKHLKILLFRNKEDDTPMSPKIPARKWLTFQKTINGTRYYLQNNQWYSIDEPYIQNIQNRVTEIFNRKAHINNIPDWEIHKDKDKYTEEQLKKINSEETYNKKLAKAIGGLCLDKQLIRPGTNPSGIETCDVLLKDGIFVHVKNASSSAPVSHLLAQALVSEEILRSDDTAQKALGQIIIKAGGDITQYSTKPKHVIIILAKDKNPITAESLYTFSKINLVRHDMLWGQMGIKLSIISIIRKEVDD